MTTKLRQAEKAKIVYEENPNYTRGALIADFGGAMGLMLGLNILDVLVFSGSVLKLIAKKIRKGLKSSFWSRQSGDEIRGPTRGRMDSEQSLKTVRTTHDRV